MSPGNYSKYSISNMQLLSATCTYTGTVQYGYDDASERFGIKDPRNSEF